MTVPRPGSRGTPHGRLPRKPAPRRPRGTGSLFIRRDRAGREVWYGKWWAGTTQIKRRIGPKRSPSTSDGLTRSLAEAELRRMIGAIGARRRAQRARDDRRGR